MHKAVLTPKSGTCLLSSYSKSAKPEFLDSEWFNPTPSFGACKDSQKALYTAKGGQFHRSVPLDNSDAITNLYRRMTYIELIEEIRKDSNSRKWGSFRLLSFRALPEDSFMITLPWVDPAIEVIVTLPQCSGSFRTAFQWPICPEHYTGPSKSSFILILLYSKRKKMHDGGNADVESWLRITCS